MARQRNRTCGTTTLCAVRSPAYRSCSLRGVSDFASVRGLDQGDLGEAETHNVIALIEGLERYGDVSPTDREQRRRFRCLSC